jgi:hypothetical protein
MTHRKINQMMDPGICLLVVKYIKIAQLQGETAIFTNKCCITTTIRSHVNQSNGDKVFVNMMNSIRIESIR